MFLRLLWNMLPYGDQWSVCGQEESGLRKSFAGFWLYREILLP